MPKIRDKYWYIVDLRKKTMDKSYYLLRKGYASKKEAKRILELNLKDRLYYFEVVKGTQAKEFGFRFRKKTQAGSYLNYIVKYDYPSELETLQDKKSYRTKYRRWKRTFNKELNKGWV